ncbi:MAG: FecR family protein [Gemmatimonadota bacterium]
MRKSLKLIGLTGLLTIAASLPAAAQQTDIALIYRLMLEKRALVTPVSAQARVGQLGERLKSGDLVNTDANTRAAIRFTDDGSLLRLNPSSQLQVRAEGDRNAVVKTLELEFGELWAKVNRKENAQFRVQTPAGVAAVKGTEFLVRVGPNGETTVITIEGIVEFFNNGGRTEVGARRKTTVTNNDQAPTTERATDDDLKASEDLIDAEGSPDEETVDIEVQLVDANGRIRTVVLTVPRRALRGVLEGGR